ncbi:MAG: 50S ribosomal protein L9 [Pelagibacteraceae bacterium]|jgi:large subunit ribosomal protein L9|nr:50S ribosomal protein L9 [Pelagibacteraceae bacterium]|tara:strand:- start:14649 stop:15104 length:456 start_codon:yes stop_codon:yes gene_type:complete
MDIILLENVINLGNIGDKVTVKNGYGRNFLLKFGKAIRFNKENEQLVIKKKAELNKKNTEIKNQFIKTAKLIENVEIVFNKECKENGELYGSIKPREITNLIKQKVNADISPSQIVLKVDLNKIGSYKAIVNLHSEVQTTFIIKIDKIKSK